MNEPTAVTPQEPHTEDNYPLLVTTGRLKQLIADALKKTSLPEGALMTDEFIAAVQQHALSEVVIPEGMSAWTQTIRPAASRISSADKSDQSGYISIV